MTIYRGFSTLQNAKKYTLTDFELIKRDLLNAFNIRQGELVGLPAYGTTLWDNIFENQTQDTERAILNEVQRVAGGDPRVYIAGIQMYPQTNGILIELDLALVPSTDAERLLIFFNQETRRASYV